MTTTPKPPATSGDDNDDGIPCQAKCDTCKELFDTTRFTIAGRDFITQRTCQSCLAKAVEKEAAELKEKRRALFFATAGVYYAETAHAHMPKERAKEVRALVKSGRGVLATGLSGTFKTTTIYNGAVRWLIETGKEVTCMTAADFKNRITEAAKACRVRAFLKPLMKVHWLFIDDLGHNITDTAAEGLHDLTEARVKAGCLPMLVTTQFGAEALMRQFPHAETGLAVCRRLRLLCEKIEFAKPTNP